MKLLAPLSVKSGMVWLRKVMALRKKTFHLKNTGAEKSHGAQGQNSTAYTDTAKQWPVLRQKFVATNKTLPLCSFFKFFLIPTTHES